jgi:hypothetical protein
MEKQKEHNLRYLLAKARTTWERASDRLRQRVHEEKRRTGSDSGRTNATNTASDVFRHRSKTRKSYYRTSSDVGSERVNFYQTFLQLINQNQEPLNNLLMSDGAHFHLSGFVNKQNFRYWSATNPTELHERPLYFSKVTVCCAISSFGIIGPSLTFKNRASYI